ncbi:MAG TPA: glyceraldehyde 3-phosphate dehydrogenase NAD-binding domain-containing protein, partial [Kofleriaceae bacterium]|nr:glyceraldehyde 3-phosphate dehydrogenase NAD-binding domain-containing protein [Kofleriaceae bacterium]
MSIRIGINGFGRMGRLALRAAWGWPDIEFVAINEVKGGPEVAAHLLEFDSVHGRWPHRVAFEPEALVVDGRKIAFSAAAAPGDAPWKQHGVDLVLECSGKFRTPQLVAPYYERGVKKVIVAAPVKDDEALNIVMGVNDHLYDPAKHRL